jgi:hypothetical protein
MCAILPETWGIGWKWVAGNQTTSAMLFRTLPGPAARMKALINNKNRQVFYEGCLKAIIS